MSEETFRLHYEPCRSETQARSELGVLRKLGRDNADPFMLYSVARVYLYVKPPFDSPGFGISSPEGSMVDSRVGFSPIGDLKRKRLCDSPGLQLLHIHSNSFAEVHS